jgi:ketosteroid isomerase-like protein
MYREDQVRSAASRRVAPRTPEEITTEFINRARAGDAEGLAELYSEDAVMAFPPGRLTEGREALHDMFEKLLQIGPRFEYEDSITTVEYHGELALTSTASLGGKGARVQVAQRQKDGTWLRLLDNPYPGRLNNAA